MSYTPLSTMIHMPLLSSLCLATSATVYWFDMLSGCDVMNCNGLNRIQTQSRGDELFWMMVR